MAGQAHHFRQYARKTAHAVKRYTNEVNRLYGVLNKQLRGKDFVTGRYSIADMAIWAGLCRIKTRGRSWKISRISRNGSSAWATGQR